MEWVLPVETMAEEPNWNKVMSLYGAKTIVVLRGEIIIINRGGKGREGVVVDFCH